MKYFTDEEICRQIDSELNFLERLIPSSTSVFKVEKRGEVRVLKFVNGSRSRYLIEHLGREVKSLRLAKEVEGITHLVHYYGDIGEFRNVLLKEYFEGNMCGIDARIININVKQRLEQTVLDLHSLRIARLDVKPENLIVSPNKEDARIADMSFAIRFFRSSQYNPLSEFRERKKEDLRKLRLNFD
jgi:serine/threonine protein kinase